MRMTKKQKHNIDRYYQGAFGAGRFGIEQALIDYEAVKVDDNSFEHAKILLAVIRSHLSNMSETLKLSEQLDKHFNDQKNKKNN